MNNKTKTKNLQKPLPAGFRRNRNEEPGIGTRHKQIQISSDIHLICRVAGFHFWKNVLIYKKNFSYIFRQFSEIICKFLSLYIDTYININKAIRQYIYKYRKNKGFSMPGSSAGFLNLKPATRHLNEIT